MELLEKLKGHSVTSIGRACNMLCIPIGQIVRQSTIGCELTQYEIHCQCAWRIVGENKEIMVASSDLYLPPTGTKWSESYQWDAPGSNLFDEKILKFNSLYKSINIQAVTVIDRKDLLISFENGIQINIFADSSEEENWRIIQRSPQSIHLVSVGNQLLLETSKSAKTNWPISPPT